MITVKLSTLLIFSTIFINSLNFYSIADKQSDISDSESTDTELIVGTLLEKINPDSLDTPEELLDALDAVDELAQYTDDPRVISALVNALESREFYTITLMYSAAGLLIDIGEPAVPSLMEALDDNSLRRGVICTFTSLDLYYPDVTEFVIELLHTSTDPGLLSGCLSYITVWGDAGYDLSGDIARLIMYEDSLVYVAALNAANDLNYRQDIIYYAIIGGYILWDYDDMRFIFLHQLARFSPTPITIDTILLQKFDTINDDSEKIWAACVLYINDPSRAGMLDIIISYLDDKDIYTRNALNAIILIGEPASRSYDQLKELSEDPEWSNCENLLVLIELFEKE